MCRINSEIVLVGDGWGAVAAFEGLQKAGFRISVLSEDCSFDSVKHIDENLSDLKGKTIVFAGYKPLVPESVLDNNICINIHYSLLPRYRGLHSTVWAILNNEPTLGLTIHIMDKYIDNGPIIWQYELKNDFYKTSKDYMEIFNEYIACNLGEIVSDYLNGIIDTRPQNKKDASWVGRRNIADCKINFNAPIGYQKNFFRALVTPYPLPFVEYNGKKLFVTKVDFQYCDVETHIGRILNIDEEGIWVKIKDGYMIIKALVDEDGEEFSLNIFRIGQYLNR